MTNELAKASHFDRVHLDMIKDMYFKGATDLEFEAFMHVCKHTGLDPVLKQIYPVKRWDSKAQKETLTVQTSIDGLRLIAERTHKYAPGREPTYVYDKNGELLSATAYVKKLTQDGTWHEIAATAFYAEYVQTNKDGKPTSFWSKMKHNQLAKCAEALALRKGWPADTAKVYIDDEMQQADVEVVAKPIKATVEVAQQPAPRLHSPATINDLHEAILRTNVCTFAELDAFLKDFAEQHNTTPDVIIRSAMTNQVQMQKLCDNLVNYQNQPVPESVEE